MGDVSIHGRLILKMDCGEIGCEDVNSIELAWDGVKEQTCFCGDGPSDFVTWFLVYL